MNVLVACEESQRVCAAFRERGHNAFSCDIQEPSGGHSEWHILGDALEVINPDTFITPDGMNVFTEIKFRTMDGETHYIGEKWDLIIAHPPCTHLAVSGMRWFKEGRKPVYLQDEAAEFFMKFIDADCDKICVENPVCIMSTRYKKPTQIINPWQFGTPEQKRTCLWLKNLPKLKETNNVYDHMMTLPIKERTRIWQMGSNHSKERSKTYFGIAKAMAEQCGNPDDYEMQMMLEEKDV